MGRHRIATDYMEKSFAGFPRSYPDGMEDDDVDALAYSPAGFIWDNALAHGKTLRDYGEFAIAPQVAGGTDAKRAAQVSGLLSRLRQRHRATSTSCSRPAIESLRPYHHDQHGRLGSGCAGYFPRGAIHQGIASNSKQTGELPNLIIICLPNDHTSGTDAGIAHPGRAGGRQRPGVWPDRRGDQPQPLLEGHLHLRDRRRSAERAGIMSAVIAPRLMSSAPTPNATRSSARNTIRPACCARWN